MFVTDGSGNIMAEIDLKGVYTENEISKLWPLVRRVETTQHKFRFDLLKKAGDTYLIELMTPTKTEFGNLRAAASRWAEAYSMAIKITKLSPYLFKVSATAGEFEVSKKPGRPPSYPELNTMQPGEVREYEYKKTDRDRMPDGLVSAIRRERKRGKNLIWEAVSVYHLRVFRLPD